MSSFTISPLTPTGLWIHIHSHYTSHKSLKDHLLCVSNIGQKWSGDSKGLVTDPAWTGQHTARSAGTDLPPHDDRSSPEPASYRSPSQDWDAARPTEHINTLTSRLSSCRIRTRDANLTHACGVINYGNNNAVSDCDNASSSKYETKIIINCIYTIWCNLSLSAGVLLIWYYTTVHTVQHIRRVKPV